MSDYNKATNFTAKDSLPTGNAGKIVKGTEIDTEFTAIASAIASKADINSAAFTGTPTAPTATAGSNTTQLATTAFVLANLPNIPVTSATAVAGTGISVTGVTTTGAATHTINNTGVTSVSAGTNISVSGSTGGVTISAPNALNAANFTGSNQSLSTNGYQKFPGGFIIQWGYANSGNITFPIAFPNSCASVTCATDRTDGSNNGYNYVGNVSTTGCTLVFDPGPGAGRWMAMGW